MECSPLTVALAYASTGYAIASVFYFTITRALDTPFHDSLTDVQREILARSKQERWCAFGASVLFAALFMIALRPFQPQGGGAPYNPP